jgi:hypothetical protein
LLAGPPRTEHLVSTYFDTGDLSTISQPRKLSCMVVAAAL